MKRSYKLLLSVLSGVLYSSAFPPLEFSILAWFSLVPLFFVIRKSSSKEAFWFSYLAGVVSWGIILYWLHNVTVPGTIVLILLLAVTWGLFGVVAKIIFKYSINLFLLAFIWIVLEYLRSHLFTGFPWALLGYTQYKNINLIQIADLTGAYGVSFLIVIFNSAFYAFLSRSKKRVSYMMVALLFIIASTSYGIYRLGQFTSWGKPRISVVQGNIPQEAKWDGRFSREIIDKYTSITKEAAKTDPDLIIWPETSYPYLVEQEEGYPQEIGSLASELNLPILAGIVSRKGNDFYNSAVLFEKDKSFPEEYEKLHLVPFGEYVPFERYITTFREYIDKPIGNFNKGCEYTLFPIKTIRSSSNSKGEIMREVSFYKFGVLICFEDIFPYLSRNFVQNGAQFLVNITNDAWFGRTSAPRQHLQASVFRAVENRVPVIRAANTGISCFIDPNGRIIKTLEKEGEDIFVSGFATSEVNIVPIRSYYTVYGDAFLYFCTFMLIVILLAEGLPSRKSEN